jgi:hypothetical protein
MKFTLWIRVFPMPPIVWVTVEGLPSTCVMLDLDKIRLRESVNPLANIVSDNSPTLKEPLPRQDCF